VVVAVEVIVVVVVVVMVLMYDRSGWSCGGGGGGVCPLTPKKSRISSLSYEGEDPSLYESHWFGRESAELGSPTILPTQYLWSRISQT